MDNFGYSFLAEAVDRLFVNHFSQLLWPVQVSVNLLHAGAVLFVILDIPLWEAFS